MAGRLFGAPVQRVEDPRLLTGRGRYVDDLRFPGMLEAAFVRSAEAHARIRGIDAAAARALPGVTAVYTMADFPEFAGRAMVQANPHPAIRQAHTQMPLATDEVCYAGQTIAVVVAENRYVAEDAAQLVAVDYEPLPAVIALADAAAGTRVAHAGAANNLAATVAWRYGDAAGAFAAAHRTVRVSLAQHRAGPHSMECRGVIAARDAISDRLTLWSSTQSPYLVRRFLAQYLGCEEADVRVVAPDVGGGFGPKAAHYPEELVLALATLRLGCPVKWIEDRREHFLATTQQRDQQWDIEAAVDADGRVTAIRGRILHDNGAYLPYGLVLPMTTLAPLPGPYAIGACDVTLDVLLTNAVPTSPIRGAGRPNAAFALERLMDAVADATGLDRAEVRQRNFVPKDAFPYRTGAKSAAGADIQYDSGDYAACLDLALGNAGYADFPARQQAARAAGRLIGMGIASYNEDTGVAPFEGVTVRVLPSGRVQVQTGACSQGQGHATVLAQIVADPLGVRMEDVIVESGDTAGFAMGVSTVGSRVAVAAGSSAHLAAMQVREKAIRFAAQKLEAAESDLEITGGAVHVAGVPEHKVTLAEMSRQFAGSVSMPLPAGFGPGLEATAYHDVRRPVFAAGTNVAEVEIDPATGGVTLTGYWVAHDCGRLINPLLVDGQIVGGVVHGIGNVLYERMVYDPASGQPQTTNFGEYLLTTAPGLPRIHVDHIETPSPENPIGVKGAGEGGTIPAIAAIAAAVEDALKPYGARIDTYPLDPERVLRFIDGANAG